jgi:hypothetical protein
MVKNKCPFSVSQFLHPPQKDNGIVRKHGLLQGSYEWEMRKQNLLFFGDLCGGVWSWEEITILSLKRTFTILSSRKWIRGFYN